MSHRVSHINGLPASTTSLQSTSVGEFFSQIPWTGIPRSAASAPDASQANSWGQRLDNQLTVKQFFSHFLWDGLFREPVSAAASEAQADLPIAENEMTLDEFANLF